MNKRNILVFGATSGIAAAVCRQFADEASVFYLIGRNPARLHAVAADLAVRGGEIIDTHCADLADPSNNKEIIIKALASLGGVDLVFIAQGSLSNQERCEIDIDYMLREYSLNFLGIASLITTLLKQKGIRSKGCIAVISSVAGDRGRRSNYVYGSTKAGLNVFLQGLRARLSSQDINVLIIKPGYVDTSMTAHLKKGLLWSTPDKVGKSIYYAILKRKREIYVPWFWRPIMLIVKLIPEPILARLKL